MRLIDADNMNFSNQHYSKPQLKAILDFIDNQPTAYDVDKVVKILDKDAQLLYSMGNFSPIKAWENKYLIPVVKAGGELTWMDMLKGAVKDE